MKPSHLTKSLLFAALSVSTSACEHGTSTPSYDGDMTTSGRPVQEGDAGADASGPRAVTLVPDVQGNYLADARGRALYLYAADVADSGQSACSDACTAKWPAFDVKALSVEDGLDLADFGRFQRADGTFQTTFKGRPLYYFASDARTGEVSGDGTSGKWFVARDYDVFLSVKAGFVPEGARGEAPYLTNSAGRTAYVFLDDAPALDGDPDPACNDTCLSSWPVWSAKSAVDDLVLPSTLQISDFASFDHAPGGRQLTYRGWPLYYFGKDRLPGETTGHSMSAFRAIDPILFAFDIASRP